MTVGERILHIKDKIIDSLERHKEAQRIGGQSCYAVGYETGKLDSLGEELSYLEGLYDGK